MSFIRNSFEFFRTLSTKTFDVLQHPTTPLVHYNNFRIRPSRQTDWSSEQRVFHDYSPTFQISRSPLRETGHLREKITNLSFDLRDCSTPLCLHYDHAFVKNYWRMSWWFHFLYFVCVILSIIYFIQEIIIIINGQMVIIFVLHFLIVIECFSVLKVMTKKEG